MRRICGGGRCRSDESGEPPPQSPPPPPPPLLPPLTPLTPPDSPVAPRPRRQRQQHTPFTRRREASCEQSVHSFRFQSHERIYLEDLFAATHGKTPPRPVCEAVALCFNACCSRGGPDSSATLPPPTSATQAAVGEWAASAALAAAATPNSSFDGGVGVVHPYSEQPLLLSDALLAPPDGTLLTATFFDDVLPGLESTADPLGEEDALQGVSNTSISAGSNGAAEATRRTSPRLAAGGCGAGSGRICGDGIRGMAAGPRVEWKQIKTWYENKRMQTKRRQRNSSSAPLAQPPQQ